MQHSCDQLLNSSFVNGISVIFVAAFDMLLKDGVEEVLKNRLYYKLIILDELNKIISYRLIH